MKNKVKRMIEAKEAKLNELREKAKVSESVEELRALNEDVDAIIAELEGLKEMYGEMDEPADPAGAGERSKQLKGITSARGDKPEGDDAEKRAQAFANSGRMKIANKEARAVLISSGKLATPTEVGDIVEGFNTVSSIVDLVNVTDAEGMGAYKVPYEDTDATAEATAEGAQYNESDPTFNFVEIKPETDTVLSYISKQVRKQTPVKYEEKVRKSALSALRKRAAKYITDKIYASTITDAIEVSTNTIGADTLRKIALSYGGDENVVGGAVLYLNKKDLVAFGDVRGTNEKKAVYEITPDASNPNTGIIKDGGLSVKYCINSNVTALSAATKGSAAIKTMLYGSSDAFELALFSDYEISVSEDYKFGQGLLSIAGDVELGGDVVKKNGFVVVTLAANA